MAVSDSNAELLILNGGPVRAYHPTRAAALPYLHTAILLCFRTAILPYCRITVLPYCHTAVLPYCRTAALPYGHTTRIWTDVRPDPRRASRGEGPSMNTLGFRAYVMHLGARGTRGGGAGGGTAKGIIA